MSQSDIPPPVETAFLSNIEELELQLQSKLGGRVLHLRVVRFQGGIILHGLSRTYHAKQIAQQTAMKICDLPLLANEIEVVDWLLVHTE